MCGICGWLSATQQIDIKIVKKMNNIVRHRGPDDEGYALISSQGIDLFRGEDSRKDSLPIFTDKDMGGVFLALGHRRLSILDLSTKGHQPMVSNNSRLCVTFNGEIYNYIELRQELKAKGYEFHSRSDTEVLLCAYQEWGENCVEHLNGMWGFAIWDADQSRLFCSRDRLGAKPFYYWMDNGNFMFSSEIKQLCQNPLVSRAMNDSVIAAEIMWGLADFSEESYIKDINVLRGGYNLVVNFASGSASKTMHPKVYQYWDIDTFGVKNEDAIMRAMSVHKDAVRIRTRSDVPIGMMLSGGLDSSTLVADVSEYFRATGRTAAEINTFTSCYEGFQEGDEREFAHTVNAHCGTTENFIYPDAIDTLSVWEKMTWHMEGAIRLNALGAFLTLGEIAKTGIRVIINGQGSDETLFGYEKYYAWYLRDRLKERGVIDFIKEWNRVVHNSRMTSILLLAYLVCFLHYPIRKAYTYLQMRNYVSKKLLHIFRYNDEMRKYTSFKNMAELQYNELRGTQLTKILHMDDRIYMAFSLESRVPFIDYRYIEEAVRIPEQLKIVGGYTKYPLRKYIEGKLPDSVVWRKNKMGWPSPRKRWIDRFDQKRINDFLQNPCCERYFDIPAIRSLWRDNPYHYAVEQFINLELFMRLFSVSA